VYNYSNYEEMSNILKNSFSKKKYSRIVGYKNSIHSRE